MGFSIEISTVTCPDCYKITKGHNDQVLVHQCPAHNFKTVIQRVHPDAHLPTHLMGIDWIVLEDATTSIKIQNIDDNIF